MKRDANICNTSKNTSCAHVFSNPIVKETTLIPRLQACHVLDSEEFKTRKINPVGAKIWMKCPVGLDMAWTLGSLSSCRWQAPRGRADGKRRTMPHVHKTAHVRQMAFRTPIAARARITLFPQCATSSPMSPACGGGLVRIGRAPGRLKLAWLVPVVLNVS